MEGVGDGSCALSVMDAGEKEKQRGKKSRGGGTDCLSPGYLVGGIPAKAVAWVGQEN